MSEKLRSDARVCYDDARALLEKGQTVGAIALLTKAIALDGDYADAYQLRGQLRYDIGDKAGAESDLRRLLELAPDSLAHVSGEWTSTTSR